MGGRQMTRLERALAALDAAVAEPEAKPEAPAPRVVAKEVQVNPGDPNYNDANRGKVQVGIYEQLYWSKVDRVFNPPIFAEVVSAYDPFARERMPGYDEGEE
jgi:hypothetical protein